MKVRMLSSRPAIGAMGLAEPRGCKPGRVVWGVATARLATHHGDAAAAAWAERRCSAEHPRGSPPTSSARRAAPLSGGVCNLK